MTRAEYLRYARAGHNIPDMTSPDRCAVLIEYFFDIRGMVGDSEHPMTMAAIKDWQEHTYVKFQKWERECMFAMDSAFRRAYNGVLQYHASRKQVKLGKDKDWNKANG